MAFPGRWRLEPRERRLLSCPPPHLAGIARWTALLPGSIQEREHLCRASKWAWRFRLHTVMRFAFRFSSGRVSFFHTETLPRQLFHSFAATRTRLLRFGDRIYPILCDDAHACVATQPFMLSPCPSSAASSSSLSNGNASYGGYDPMKAYAAFFLTQAYRFMGSGYQVESFITAVCEAATMRSGSTVLVDVGAAPYGDRGGDMAHTLTCVIFLLFETEMHLFCACPCGCMLWC